MASINQCNSCTAVARGKDHECFRAELRIIELEQQVESLKTIIESEFPNAFKKETQHGC